MFPLHEQVLHIARITGYDVLPMLRWFIHKPSLFWTLQLLGWGAFGVSMVLATLAWLPPWLAVRDKIIFTVLGLLFSLSLRALYRRLYQRQLALPWLIVSSAVCAYLAAMLWTGSYSLSVDFLRAWQQSKAFTPKSWLRYFEGGLYHSFILLAWSVLYFGIKHYRELQAQTERALKAEALAQQAQLQALRYQLNPHFLFNTLNAISTLVVQQENAAANRMLARLSDFLRLTLDSSSAAEVTLADELDFARRYLEIEQVRLGERLVVNFEIDPSTLAAAVPNLLLQPLIENAIRHSIAPREAGGTLAITARRHEDRLQLEVRDDGTQSVAHFVSNGTGLANTQARLTQLYGAAHRFALQDAASGGLSVVIELPFRSLQAQTKAYENSHAHRG